MQLNKVKSLIIEGNTSLINNAVYEAVRKNHSPEEIMYGMILAMESVGEEFKKGNIIIPELLLSSKAMAAGISVLKPYFSKDAKNKFGKVIIGTVEGDLHDLGKNLIAMLLESIGFEIIDLGVDVPIKLFLTTYEENPDTKIIACSAMLTTTLPLLQKTVTAINNSPWRHQVKVMVGGAAVTQEFAERIGADAYTPDAPSAIGKALDLLQLSDPISSVHSL